MHSLDHPLGGERAEERACSGDAEHCGIARGFDREPRVDHERDARVATAEQELAAARRHHRVAHLVAAQLRCRRSPVALRRAGATAAERQPDAAVQPRRNDVQDDGGDEHAPHVEHLERGCARDPDEPGAHAEQQRDRIGCDQLVRWHEVRNRGCAHRVQHARREQQEPERREADPLALCRCGDDRPEGQRGSHELPDHEQLLARETIGDQAGDRPDEQQRKRGDGEPAQERERGVVGVQVKEQHLCQPERRHRVGDLRSPLSAHRNAEVARGEHVATAHVLLAGRAQDVKVHLRRAHDVSVAHNEYNRCRLR